MPDFKGFDDWIEIFEGGRQVDSRGREHDGDQIIDRALTTFDPKEHEPPLVVGHPRENSPAFGWVEALKSGVRNGAKVLLARFKQVVPEFEEMVRSGLFKKRSASFYPDGRLRHVGFLGAMPPAVKGLADLKFGDDGETAATFEFAASDDKAARAARAKKYGIAVKEGGHVTKPAQWAGVPDEQWLDPVNYRYPCPDAAQVRAAASYWGRETNRAQYTPEERAIITARLDKFRKKFKVGTTGMEEGKMTFKDFVEIFKFWKQVEADPGLELPALPASGTPKKEDRMGKQFSEEDLKKAREEAARKAREEAQKEFAEKERKRAAEARRKEISEWCDARMQDGKLAPAWVKAGIKEFMERLDAEAEVSFAEGKKETPLAWFKDFVAGLPKLISFDEIAGRDGAPGDGDAASKLDALTRKRMAEKDLDYGAAFAEVQKENPGLVDEYSRELSAAA